MLDRIKKAFNNSLEGLIVAYDQERSFREDLVICALFFPLALFSDHSNTDKAILIFSLFFILVAELANTAIEVVVDRISQDDHPLSKNAKDIGSAVVFLALANAAVTWSLIYFL